jgi:F-type H+-transporting ATPase subunit b
MLIDPFTIVVQLINFIILVVALKLVLFDRIVRHMDERQAQMAQQRSEAHERLEEAEQKRRDLDRRLEQIEHEREGVLAEAREEARARRQELIETARHDVDEQRARWWQAVEDEQDQLVERIRARVGEEVVRLTGRALQDLADVELEERFLKAFEDRFAAMSEEDRQELRGWLAEDGHPTVVSTAELDDAQRTRIRQLIGDVADGDVEVAFEEDGSLAGGLEVQVGGRAIGWTVDAYLERLEEAVRGTLSQDRDAGDDAASQ